MRNFPVPVLGISSTNANASGRHHFAKRGARWRRRSSAAATAAKGLRNNRRYWSLFELQGIIYGTGQNTAIREKGKRQSRTTAVAVSDLGGRAIQGSSASKIDCGLRQQVTRSIARTRRKRLLAGAPRSVRNSRQRTCEGAAFRNASVGIHIRYAGTNSQGNPSAKLECRKNPRKTGPTFAFRLFPFPFSLFP